MTLRNTQVVRFSPTGLSDSLDMTDEFPGACALLTNLIPDITTRNIWTCRPASILLTDFTGFTTPGYISVFKVVGNYVYGMIASGRTAGKDEPFCYDLINSVFKTVTNVTATNVPTSPATTGDWTPPTMDLVGVNLVVTHPGFTGTNGYFGWFDVSNQSAPRWHSGNLYATGAIITLGAISGGTLYTAGTYKNVALTGGTGAGAKADITVAGGAVTIVAMDISGSGYTAGDSLSASSADIGGTGSGFSVLVGTVQLTGAITMTTPPSWVRQFYQRAYFGINPPPTGAQPSVILTDALSLGVTNANQVLTFGDNIPLVAAAPLGLSNQLGGIIASLMIFKDDSSIAQVTGDYAFSSLSVNYINVNTGTIAPRSVCNTPYGIAFLDHDGFRVIDFDARVGDPVGAAGKGVVAPFVNALYPTRVNASCDGNIMRASVQNSTIAGTPWQEYWYDLVRKTWSGPHSFASSMIDVYTDYFILAPQSAPGKLFTSTVIPIGATVYVENGTQLTWNMQTVVLADNGQMAQSEITELQVKTTAIGPTEIFTVNAVDEGNSVYKNGSFTYSVALGVGGIWGTMVWGSGNWGSTSQALYPRQIEFPGPVVYNRLALNVTGSSASGFKIGDIFLRARTLGYLQSP